MDLTDRTVLVTGAGGTGVGSGVCRAVVEAGGNLVVHEREVHEADRAAERYGAAAAYGADLAVPERVHDMFAKIAADVGRLDGLVNNAGIGLSRPAHEATVEEYDRLNAVDGRGVWLACRAFARIALSRGTSGSIVNVSSVHARASMRGYALYAGVKAEVEGLTRGLAVELGPYGIRCNAIAPGYVHSEQNEALIRTWSDDPAGWVHRHTTDHQALERQIEPIDCGWAAVFFLSDRARAVTGQVLRVDAGTTSLLYDRAFT